MDTQNLIHGDSTDIMRQYADGSFTAVITDPPYASGGMTASERRRRTSAKYQVQGTAKTYADFPGDSRDQRAHFIWSVEWMKEAYRITREGGWIMAFADWRQLPCTSDAMQCAGWIWRGLVVWDKTEACRPSLGMFRNQAEYIVIGTKGSLGSEQKRPVRVTPAGVFRKYIKPGDKQHLTGKPVELMEHLMQVLPPNSRVLDPFAGSGTTILAARNMGHEGVGIEITPEYVEIARSRLAR
ncbi:site-specific DNA-methyltransferase [Akkermansia glycaniphila]|uniref:DNA-methyltransferase n=1 Tax=Akkermansia glycaniphila TaxID=1679444 RepID=UPI001C028CCA|nr:site-specific DNA-methyltransferase [Akkermansia glycaniphila]MBT9448782.1 site-specific DNA-methyltransferase [Akkermansia glycaniphila]